MCPLVPWLPCLGIFVNSYMIASLKEMGIIFHELLYGSFLVLYCTYFMDLKNSNLNFQKFAPKLDPLLNDQKMMNKPHKSVQHSNNK